MPLCVARLHHQRKPGNQRSCFRLSEQARVTPAGRVYDLMSEIADHKNLVMAFGLLVTIIGTGLVVLPLARKWQANAEE